MRRLIERKMLLISEDYYVAKSGKVSDYIDRWQSTGDKAYDDSMPVIVDVSQLWPYREYTWTRDTARSGYARIDGKKFDLSGNLKWDAMKADLKKNGWDSKEPLYFEIGRSGGAKVGEGNHRLALAREVGIRKVPVVFLFKAGKVKKSKKRDSKIDVPKAIVRAVVKSDAKKPVSKQNYKRGKDPSMDNILDLLLGKGM